MDRVTGIGCRLRKRHSEIPARSGEGAGDVWRWSCLGGLAIFRDARRRAPTASQIDCDCGVRDGAVISSVIRSRRFRVGWTRRPRVLGYATPPSQAAFVCMAGVGQSPGGEEGGWMTTGKRSAAPLSRADEIFRRGVEGLGESRDRF